MNAVALSSLADSSSSGIILALVILLVAIGIAMSLVTVWLIRSTRPDRPLLARLELMGTRGWRRSSTARRQHELEQRPVADTKDPTPSGGVDRPDLDGPNTDTDTDTDSGPPTSPAVPDPSVDEVVAAADSGDDTSPSEAEADAGSDAVAAGGDGED